MLHILDNCSDYFINNDPSVHLKTELLPPNTESALQTVYRRIGRYLKEIFRRLLLNNAVVFIDKCIASGKAF